jgi:hypothetical protein
MSATYPEIPAYDQDIQFNNIDDAINVFVATRDELAAERKAYNTYEARAKHYMDRIEMFIKDKADDLGVDSFRTKSGTAFRNVKTSYRVSVWPEYLAWLQETGNFQCLEHRAAKNAVKEVHDETGEVPPGLEYTVEVGFDVRRPSK